MTDVQIIDGVVTPNASFEVTRTDFKIKQSAHALHILSTSLYSRPMEAIVRELVCNGIDSHRAACQDLPMSVTFGYNNVTGKERICFRDYGTGLAPSDLERMYTTYFDSTKEADDDYIGSFGLGSKTPFAYTNMFTVSSYYFGIKYTYEASVDEDTKIPMLTKINVEEANDIMNGLEVSFDIKDSRDSHNFRVACRIVLPYFGKQVSVQQEAFPFATVRVGKYCYLEMPERLIDLPSFFLESNVSRDDKSVLLNNVKYRLDVNRFTLFPDNLKSIGITLVASANNIDVTPSREELHYNIRTMKALEELIKTASAELEAYIATIVKDLSAFELRVKYKSLQKQYGMVLFPEHNTINGITVRGDQVYSSKFRWEVIKEREKWKSNKHERTIHVSTSDRFDYVDVDRIRFLIADKNVNQMKSFMLHYFSTQTNNVRAYIFKTQEEFNAFKVEMYIPDTYSATPFSAINKPKISRKPRTTGKNKVYTAGSGIFGSDDSCWSEAEINVGDIEDAIYVPVLYWKALIFGEKHPVNPFVKLMKKFNPNFVLYGIKEADVVIVNKLDNWRLLDDYIMDVYSNLTLQLKDMPMWESSAGGGFVGIMDKFSKYDIIAKVPYIADYHKVKTEIDSKADLKALRDYLHNIIPCQSRVGLTVNKVCMNHFSNQLYTQFPMLRLLSNWLYHLTEKDMKTVLEYMETVLSIG